MIDYLIAVLTGVVIIAIGVVGLNLHWGWGGMLNMSFIALVAVGAYVSATLQLGPSSDQPADLQVHYILGFHLPWILAIAGGVVAAALVSLLIGAVGLRGLRTDYFAIVTLAVTLILQTIIGQNQNIFNGQEGLYNVPQPLSNFVPGGTIYSIFFLAVCLLVLAFVYLLTESLQKSPFGRAVRASRDDETAANAFGKNVYWLQLRTFVLGGAIAGLAGGLLGAFDQAFNPPSWTLGEMFLWYIALFVGGSGNNRGIILGVFLVAGLFAEGTRYLPTFGGDPSIIPSLRQIVIGLLIILVMRWRPQGLFPERSSMDGPALVGRRWTAFRGVLPGLAPSRSRRE